MVLDEVWRRLDGVEALSGPHGGPLRRTVKLILDPLVIRPVQHPECAGSILTADGAVLLATRMHAAADVLRATADWFTLLKATRRALRITEGNAQDLYFQRCFELATVSGTPDPVRDRAAAEEALRDIHDMTAGRTTQALKEYLNDPENAREVAELIQIAWRRRPFTAVDHHTAQLTGLLEACAAERLGRTGDDDSFDDLVTRSVGTHTGIRLWQEESGGFAQQLGLTAHPLPQSPEVGRSAAKATLGLPLDRTIHERVFTVLQASIERSELPSIPELVDAEIARACAPWALLDESLRVAVAAGATLAVRLQPLDSLAGQEMPTAAITSGPEPAAAQVINGRWQREAYVLQARRLVVHGEAEGPLGAIASELQVPWRPYMRRLWARMHGRDVRELPVYAADELWDVLDGVARSVILDHRARVKKALALVVTEPETMESRAG
ncbi:hypothetical protein [Nocardia huaxiensis]|uniref:Uncharacterized protein n=1 Tax=Nocardia huaxiensis TaxID=2755382 RepID=A0A7D6ZUP2_9NOCA|nr:hypothetical protein [Nocardia huaxiensis]QLY34365.1 hypothetical protein H0264_13525 [Nocardia huaxiensis]UFT00048.1 hypothetical protein LPY97_19835 [Nocardia huaxiensis]